MKKVLLLAAALYYTATTFAQWEQVEQIVQAIGQVPLSEKKVITISAKQAKDATKAINKAIADCNKAGGGKVIIPAGEFFTGPIVLLSNVNLHISEGAVLKFSTNPKDYTPFVLSRWEGMDCYNFKPLIYAYKQTNIAITGTGVLDGQASDENWWPWKLGAAEAKAKGIISQNYNPNHLPGRPKLDSMNDNNVPIEQRMLTEDHRLRPPFIQPLECTNVLIEGITITNAPFWLIHPTLCENVTVRKVRMDSPNGPNNDGCDPESCKNVLIEDCYFNTGDDCIAIKSGRNNDGRKWARPSENIVIRNCVMKDGHGGVVVGSEISGDCRNVFAENCEMDSKNLERAVRIKSNPIRGGLIENIYVRNITVGVCKEAILRVEMKYEKVTEGDFMPIVRNVNLENITSKSSRYGVYIDGYKGGKTVSNINLKNCEFTGIKEQGLNKIVGAENVTFQNSTMTNAESVK
ncbi:MAG: glycoside hydrolase family 28 protein [Bacteroidales bacterium]|jgi:polygalacturonase|nr:glycoside hydrolase family 28 protein [Bacteroidales bacterium]